MMKGYNYTGDDIDNAVLNDTGVTFNTIEDAVEEIFGVSGTFNTAYGDRVP